MEGMRQAWVEPPPPPHAPGRLRAFPVHAAGGRPVAGFGYRVAAFLFDAGLVLAFLTGAILVDAGGTAEVLVAILGWVFVTSVASAVFDGQTLGKRLTGTRVLTAGGVPAGFGTSLLRDSLARLLYLVPFFFLVDSIFAAADPYGQTLRDKMAGTYVVRETRSPGRATAVAFAAAALLAIWVGGTSMAGGEPGEGYSSYDHAGFLEGCREEGSSAKRCECLYEYISSRLSHDEFTGVGSDDPDKWPARVRRVTDDAAVACDGGQPAPDPARETAMSAPRNRATS